MNTQVVGGGGEALERPSLQLIFDIVNTQARGFANVRFRHVVKHREDTGPPHPRWLGIEPRTNAQESRALKKDPSRYGCSNDERAENSAVYALEPVENSSTQNGGR